MASKTGAKPSRPRSPRGLSLLACLVIVPAVASVQDVNTIKKIATVDSGVEIEVTSTREFPVRDELVGLRIGQDEFTISRSPEGGSLNTLIFSLTGEEFANVANGAPVFVQFGRGESPDRWEFGPLDKTRLDK